MPEIAAIRVKQEGGESEALRNESRLGRSKSTVAVTGKYGDVNGIEAGASRPPDMK